MTELSFMDILKITFRVIGFKIQQKRLTTNEKHTIATVYGPVTGNKRYTIYNHEYYSFEGIPFAKPPIGELRFKAPQKPELWTEAKDCTYLQEKPVQPNLVLKKIQGSEDCLYLNLYTNNLKPEKPRPVMVWIYGGGFQMGEASRDLYSPDFFMTEEVVLVCLTYRLGPLGFLSLADQELEIPGNAGLKDQVLGLKWVKENCAYFGGDPDNITVFGESAGGASTHLMMLTEQTRGLFHKGITMSGSSICDWAISPPNNYAYRLATATGYTGQENDKDIFKYLSSLKGEELIQAGGKILNSSEKRSRVLFVFGPTVEPYEGPDCILTKHPKEMLSTSWGNQIPLMIGGNSFEGLLFYPETKRRPKILDEIEECQYLVPTDLGLDPESEECKKKAEIIKTTHFGDKKPGKDTLFEYLDLLSIKHFWNALYHTAMSRLENATAPTYLYRFDFDSPYFNYIRILLCGKKIRGTCHGDDLGYIFHNTFGKRLDTSSLEYKTITRMVKTWVKFAETGNPNNDELGDVKFDPVSKSDNVIPKCLNISDKIEFKELPEIGKIQNWNKLYNN